MLDSRRLAVFVAVAELGSFTAAAERLYLTQPAVSQQVAALEREVGVQLLRRTPRGVELTPAGELLAGRSAGVLQDLTRLEQDILSLTHVERPVRLGSFSTAGGHLVPRAVKGFRRSFPDRPIAVSHAPPEAVSAMVREGSIDVGLVWDYDLFPRRFDPSLVVTPLLLDPLVLLLPEGHPFAGAGEVSLGDLADETWVIRRHSGPYADSFEQMCRSAGFEPREVFWTEDYESVQGMVAVGLGVSLVPELSLATVRPEIVVCQHVRPRLLRRIAAVTLPTGDRSRQASDLVRVLAEVAQSLAAEHGVP
jgi:DNA-binding transcriptional LysR family regulator